MHGRRVLGLVAGGALLVGTLSAAPAAHAQFGYQQLTAIQKRHVSGALADALGPRPAVRLSPSSATKTSPGAACDGRIGANTKVNQNCQNVSDADLNGRGQAQNETWVAVNPHDSKQVVASYNDYRRGDGTCGVSYSGDGGRGWTDSTVPNGFVRGTAFGDSPREYFQSGGDTSLGWDSRGNLYLMCQEFKRGPSATTDPDQSSGFYVYRSGTGGASFNFPGRPVAEHDDTAGKGDFLLDKELMAVDSTASSPYRDRVYVTWTQYDSDGTAYIYESHSADYGEHFSAPALVSSDSALCGDARGAPTPRGRCNNNQFSEPVIASDGTLYVVWANYNGVNTGTDNRFQIMAARSSDGGASFTSPVKAGDFYDLPDCDTYQGQGADPGRDCVPEKGASKNSIFRATNYPYAAVDPGNPKKLVVTYGSYINRDSNETKGCTPAGFTDALGNLYTGVKNGGCNNDIVVSTSTDGGASFDGTTTDVRKMPVVGGGKQNGTDQYWQGMTYGPSGPVVAYYDRQYGSDNTTGASDISVTAGGRTTRATSSSMPAPTQFNGQFYGDYIQVSVAGRTAYPVWSDTRTPELFPCAGSGPPAVCTGRPPGPQTVPQANDEEIAVAAVPIH